MRLTKDMRYSIVEAVMQDTRRSANTRELMRARAHDVAVDRLPRLVRQVWNDPNLRGYVDTVYFSLCCVSYTLPGLEADWRDIKAAVDQDPQWSALHTQYDEQSKAEGVARETLYTTLSTYTTTEKFGADFPELVKYLPTAAQATVNVPATTDVMDKLRAAGLAVDDVT